MITVFKTDKYLKGIRALDYGITINCNAGAITTNQMGNYGNLNVWYLPKGIAIIFLMHELEKLYRITYNSWMVHYVVHPPKGAVNFYKEKQGNPYIDLDGAGEEAVIMLLQCVHSKQSKTPGDHGDHGDSSDAEGPRKLQMVHEEGCTGDKRSTHGARNVREPK